MSILKQAHMLLYREALLAYLWRVHETYKIRLTNLVFTEHVHQ